MVTTFEEIDYRVTPIGTISLRRRHEPKLGLDVFEIKLDDEFLMSSLFTKSEIALAKLGLSRLENRDLTVVVGGLGLGYTACAVLEHDEVGELIVVEMLEAVIEWHRQGKLPLGPELTNDPRCHLVAGDFFELAAGDGFDPECPGRRFDAILLDIDHSPEALLDNRSSGFYRPDGLRALAAHLKPGGIFGLWSNDRPDPVFTEKLATMFAGASAEAVTFHNPMQDLPFTQTIYLARTANVDQERARTNSKY